MTINYTFKFGWEVARGLLISVAVYLAFALRDFSVPSDWQVYTTGLMVGIANVIGTKFLDMVTGQSGITIGSPQTPPTD